MQRLVLATAGLAGAASTAGDAAAKHLLAADPARAELASIAARYGLIHALALLALAALLAQAAPSLARKGLVATCWCFIGGILLFCGGLGLLAAGFPQVLVWMVPVGGSLFILGWAVLFIAALAFAGTTPPPA
jgi:uncharacterized membrane protein YgdD (TMEM256/DUF423 family)